MSGERKAWRYFGLTLLSLMSLAALVLVQPMMVLADGVPGPPSDSGAQPIWVEDNPKCEDLGYRQGFKPQPEPPPSGEYVFPDGANSVTISSDGVYFDWYSTLGIDAVIVKGGPNANLYEYDPPKEAFDDANLHAPINPDNEKPYEISHIDFCYDEEEPSPDITVVKTVDPEYLLAPGGTVVYTVQVTDNSASEVALTLTALEDSLYGDLTAADNPLISNSTCKLEPIPPGGTYTCTFEAEVSGEPGDVVTDLVTAVAADPSGREVKDDDEATVTLVTKPPDTGIDLPAPVIVSGLAALGIALLAAGVWLRRRSLLAG